MGVNEGTPVPGPQSGADPEGGIDPITGSPRQSGQDETVGETETTSGEAPASFPVGAENLDLSQIEVQTGWTLLPDDSFLAVGDALTLYLRFAHGAGAAALAAILPTSYVTIDVAEVASDDGKFTITASNGHITYNGDTTDANAGPVICMVTSAPDGHKVH